jgi:hypothetical protein
VRLSRAETRGWRSRIGRFGCAQSGGRLAITDLDAHEFAFLRTEHHDRWMGFERDAVYGWLLDAGLETVGTDCVGADCCADSSSSGESASISIFVAFGRKRRASA